MLKTDVATQAEIGARIAQARAETGLTQAALAERVDMERTQLVRVEGGERKVTVRELAAIARELDVPIDIFVTDAPATVLSRRANPASGHETSLVLDREVERSARDIRWLLERQLLSVTAAAPEAVPDSFRSAESMADRIRNQLGVGDESLVELGRAVEQLGVVWFSLDLGETDDGACIEIDTADGRRAGVAVINGNSEPGRRRWTLAHELGHFLTGDAYAADHPAVDVERFLNAFVAYLLMPRSGVNRIWNELKAAGPDRVALAIAARYRTSWTAACNQLSNLHLIDHQTYEAMVERFPSRGDYLAAGEAWAEELAAPSVPPAYSADVLAAYASGELAAAKTLDLLRGTLTAEELPARSIVEVITPMPEP
jgi:Zn-dependent peptidase ImmA (M78 family)/DNA-binding XRE family transcriptional regulator